MLPEIKEIEKELNTITIRSPCFNNFISLLTEIIALLETNYSDYFSTQFVMNLKDILMDIKNYYLNYIKELLLTIKGSSPKQNDNLKCGWLIKGRVFGFL